jgi:membrane fusion protein (multidrug efflux system)
MSERRGRWALAPLGVLAAAVVVVWVLRLVGTRDDEPDEAAATVVDVRIGHVARATMRRYLTAYGRVEPAPAREGRPPAGATLGAPVSGALAEIDCAEGVTVHKGARLFRLDTRAAEAALSKARSALDFSEKTYDRQKALIAADGTSTRALQEAEQQRDAARAEVMAAEAEIALRTVTAPIDGTVVRVPVHLGQTVDSATVLAEVVDLRRLVVAAQLPSREAAAARVGQEVRGAAGDPIGRVSLVGDAVDPASDSVRLLADLSPGATRLLPGRFVEIRVVADEHERSLVVPESSVVTRADEGSWIVRVEGDRATRQVVRPGIRDGGLVEVEGEGLEEGEAIVVDDAYGLPPDTRVRIVPR